MTTASPPQLIGELSTTALIGTDRHGGGQDGPRKLLTQAAIAFTQARAGHRPGRGSEQLPPCPVETRPAAPGLAISLLERLLADPDAGLIDEWCNLAHTRSQRVTDAIAPLLLEWWSRQPQRSEVVFAVTGVLGPWLCGLNPSWNKPVASSDIPADADERWQTGTPAERAALLTTIRRHDAARGLALVASTWATDGADERRRFLEVLGQQVSSADEPFLEKALDDRAKTVRQQAATVLSALPGSQLRTRLSAAARACITVTAKRSLLGRAKVTLAVEPPKDFDKLWERDGIDESAAQGKGQRAHWLRQLLSAAELSIWSAHSGLDAGAFLKALAEDDYFDDVLTALIHALSITPDPVWTHAILQAALDRPKRPWQSLTPVWTKLPAAHREPLLLEVAAHARFTPQDRWAILSAQAGAQTGAQTESWSHDFSLRAMKLLTDHPAAKAELNWELTGQIRQISSSINPSALAAFEQALTANCGDTQTDSIRASLNRVRLRADMCKEFSV